MLNKTQYLFPLLFALIALTLHAAPDTVTNRYATTEDAAHWPSVNEGDYIFFQGNNDGGDDIYAAAGTNHLKIELPVGKKILIYAGDYERILINGEACQSTKENPTIVTNLGGQVRWGYSQESNQYRTLELYNFDHIYLTGKYDATNQTGHPDYLGHDGGAALDSGDYYERYGLWGNPRWSGPTYHGSHGNGVRIYKFETVKIDYVSSWGGYFASFNIKTDNPANPSEVEVDIQDCFAGFGEGEAFYISYSTKAHDQDITKLTLKNNITAFTGAEALQTDNLAEGTVIENNVCLGSATYFRHPFQARFQDNLHQFSFVEGNITMQNNILVGTNGALHNFRYRDANSGTVTGRTDPAANKPVTMLNNFYGFGRTNMGYMWQGDGITPYLFKDNVYGHITVPGTDDTLSVPPADDSGFFNLGNSNTDITFDGNIYPHGRDLYFVSTGDGSNITRTSNLQQAAPTIQFKNSGFPNDIDWRTITSWAAQYDNTPPDSGLTKDGDFIPYALGDIVIFYDSDGYTKFFECIQAHAGNHNPNTAAAYWTQLKWNGRNMPPLDLRIEKDTYYNYRGMGLTYNEANESTPDLEAPVITLTGDAANFKQGSPYYDPGCQALDNLDGDITDQVQASWVGTPYDPNQTGNYLRRYSVVDNAGNIAADVYREVSVSDSNISVTKQIQINMHQLNMVNLSDWTDLGNNHAGLLNPKPSTTLTTLYDTNTQDSGYTLTIHNIEGGSEHYKAHNNSAGRAIGDFPASVTKMGLRIRDPHENPCVLLFEGLPAASYYDIKFTGYVSGTGDRLESTLTHPASGQSSTVNIRDNQTEVGTLANVTAESDGSLEIEFTTGTADSRPNISGLIIVEKTGAGIASAAPTLNQPSDLDVILGQSSPAIDLVLADADTATSALGLTAFSSNEAVLPVSDIVTTGSDANRQVTLTPRAAGTTTVTLLVDDGLSYSPYSFQVNVTDAKAPTVRVVGDGTDYDVIGAEAVSFRSTDVTKHFDANGDYAYGTEGYFFYGNGTNANSNADGSPSWVSTVTASASNVVVLEDYNDFDNPTAAIAGTVADWTATGLGTYRNDTAGMWSELLTFTVDGTAPRAFRLGIMAGNEGNTDGRWDPIALRITYAGSPLGEISSLGKGLGLVFFDISLPDSFTGSFTIEGQTRDTSTDRGVSIAGVVFDAPEDTPFANWMFEHGLSGTNTKFDVDSDGDGYANGIEFAFGGHPASRNQLDPSARFAGANLVFEFDRNPEANSSTSQVFQYSENLEDWTDIKLTGIISSEVSIGAMSDGVEPITVTIDTTTVRNQFFWRLKVDQGD